MKKFLIVYYSRTGISKKAAERLYELLEAEYGKESGDIEEIIDVKDRSGFFGALTSVKDAIADNITKIEAVKNAPSGYLEVIAVTPVWCGRVADAIRTYLAAYRSDIRMLKLVVCGGSDSVEQGAQIQRHVLRSFALKTKALATLKSRNVQNGDFDDALKVIIESEEIGDDPDSSGVQQGSKAVESLLDKGGKNEKQT